MPVQAIQTSYNKHLFRSRLEARYAVFFDALGWDWQYEPEGFDLPVNGYYLPDFFVSPTPWCHWPSGPFWLEIKADSSRTSRLERERLQELCCETQICGFMGFHKNLKTSHREDGFFNGTSVKPYELFDGAYWPFKQYKSPQQRRVKDFHTGEVWEEEKLWLEMDAKPSALLFELVEAAQELALKARFEHGEHPSITNRILALRERQRSIGPRIKDYIDRNPLFRP
tara:strand:- start:80 stop:757 length:678 start_codon:yes stop_codon:yes gene_type:complete